MRRITVVVSIVLTFTLVVGAQDKPKEEKKPPVLTAEQNKALDQMLGVMLWTAQNVETKRIELASAEADLKKAQDAAGDLIRKLQVEGFDLDVPNRVYTPKKDKKKQ